MIRKVRKVVKRTYDKYSTDEYPLFTDNLNPHYDTEMSVQVDKMLATVQQKVAAIYDSLEEPYEMESVPTNEGLNNDIDKLMGKMLKNPLVGLKQMGFNIDGLVGSAALNQLGNPMGLDCFGLTKSNLAGLVGTDYLEGFFSLDYEITFEPDTNCKTEYDGNKLKLSAASLPINASNFNITVFPGYAIAALKDSNEKALEVITLKDFDDNKKLTLKISTKADDGSSDGIDFNMDNPANSGTDGDEDKDCALQELAWLKYILAVCDIIKILVNIVSTVLGIVVPLIDMIKQATIAWVDPPMFAAIINDISQKLMSLVFSIIGSLLMKLWALLDFDCVSAEAAEVIVAINEVLAGIQECMGAVDALALEIEGLSGLGDIFNELIANIGKQINDMIAAWNWQNMQAQVMDALKSAGNDWTEAFTNPDILYSEAVPDEIKSDIQNYISLYREGKAAVNNTVNTIEQLINMFNKTPTEKENSNPSVSSNMES